jgi:hypothetical protein
MPDDRLGGEEAMTVDHFRPEGRFPKLALAWANLYYACSTCNSHYKKDYPTPDEEAEGKRFVDPCAEDPDDHFRLVRAPGTCDVWEVRALSPAAEYVVFRLKLNRRKFLRDFWRCLCREESQLLRRENEIRNLLADCEQQSKRCGPSAELDRLQADCRSQLDETRVDLVSVRLLRPFPVE